MAGGRPSGREWGLVRSSTTLPPAVLMVGGNSPGYGLLGTLALTLREHSMIVRADRARARRNAGIGRGVSAWNGRHC
jgi:hypothetical protein